MFSFLTQLRDQVFTRRDSCPEESCQTTTYTVPEKLDEEDDGYLLVGDTRAGQNKVTDTQAACRSVLDGENIKICEHPAFSNIEPLQMNPAGTVSYHNQRSPICDVPFQLHPSLDAPLQAHAICNNTSLDHQSFDWSKFSYSFMSERICLQEMSSDEMANIDEFLLPHADAFSINRSTEINFMQF